jgi:hypothetical protein
MSLWTHHPSSFPIDALVLPVDPEQGQYWNHQAKKFRYRAMAHLLWKSLGTNQFLWCTLERGTFIRLGGCPFLGPPEMGVPTTHDDPLTFARDDGQGGTL